MSVKVKEKGYEAFTLIEMLVVLLVIAVLIFLFVPNLNKQRTLIETRGDDAFTKVVKTQINLFKLNEARVPTYEELISGKYLTAEQVVKAKKIGIDLSKLDDLKKLDWFHVVGNFAATINYWDSVFHPGYSKRKVGKTTDD